MIVDRSPGGRAHQSRREKGGMDLEQDCGERPMTSIGGMKLYTAAQHPPRWSVHIRGDKGVLRRVRIFVRIWNWLLVRQSIGLGLFDGIGLFDRRNWPSGAGTSSRNGNLLELRHDGENLSVWQEGVLNFLRRFIFIRRNGIGFFDRWTLSVRRWFRYIWHSVSPGYGNKQLTTRHACSIGAQI